MRERQEKEAIYANEHKRMRKGVIKRVKKRKKRLIRKSDQVTDQKTSTARAPPTDRAAP